MIEHKDLELPKTTAPVIGEGEPVLDEGPSCVACRTKLLFSPDANETIAIRRICAVSQVIVTCPVCMVKMAIFPAGVVPIEASETEVVFGVPVDGYRIARLADLDAIEAGGHDLTMIAGPVAGVSTYYCENCGGLVFLRSGDVEVFHVPKGSSSNPGRCTVSEGGAKHVTLKSKLCGMHERDIERLKGV